MPEINIPHAQANHDKFSKNEQRFDIAVYNVPAKDFFMGLIKDTPYNMTVNPQIKGNISLELKNVTIPQTMEAVRDTYISSTFWTERIGPTAALATIKKLKERRE